MEFASDTKTDFRNFCRSGTLLLGAGLTLLLVMRFAGLDKMCFLAAGGCLIVSFCSAFTLRSFCDDKDIGHMCITSAMWFLLVQTTRVCLGIILHAISAVAPDMAPVYLIAAVSIVLGAICGFKKWRYV